MKNVHKLFRHEGQEIFDKYYSGELLMIGEPVGLIVRKNFERPSAELVRIFQGVPTGFVVDAQNGTGALDWRIKPVDSKMCFAGPAMTVEAEPRDYLPVQPAIALSQPGDVLVISNGGYDGAAVIGDNVAAMARKSRSCSNCDRWIGEGYRRNSGGRDSGILLWSFSQFPLCAWSRESWVTDRYFSIGNSTGRYDCWRWRRGSRDL